MNRKNFFHSLYECGIIKILLLTTSSHQNKDVFKSIQMGIFMKCADDVSHMCADRE